MALVVNSNIASITAQRNLVYPLPSYKGQSPVYLRGYELPKPRMMLLVLVFPKPYERKFVVLIKPSEMAMTESVCCRSLTVARPILVAS